ncbi:MAG: DUF2490 domain-containing protein [Flavisolibacter sp.]|nr:DUF2490 domain-containing protein [Flavisolibacter sp.]
MNRSFLIAITSMAFSFIARAQVQQSGWFASFNTLKLNNHFSLHLDVQLRSTDNLEHVQTLLIRPGLNYHLTKRLTVTAGYAYIPNRRTISNVSDLLPEHRIWEQLLYAHKWSTISTSHRLRLEQRFIPHAVVINNELGKEGHQTAHRLRYFIRNIVPLTKLTKDASFSKGFFFALQDEVFGNVGNTKAVNGKFFDQNRLYGAFGYRLPYKIDVEAGYMHQYISTASRHVNNHIVQLAVYKGL